jgi:hypothetical protein
VKLPSIIADNVTVKCAEIDLEAGAIVSADSRILAQVMEWLASLPGRTPLKMHFQSWADWELCRRDIERVPGNVDLTVSCDCAALKGISPTAWPQMFGSILERKATSVVFHITRHVWADTDGWQERLSTLYVACNKRASFVLVTTQSSEIPEELLSVFRRQGIPCQVRPDSPCRSSVPHRLEVPLCGPCPAAGSLRIQADGIVSFCPFQEVRRDEPFCVGSLQEHHISQIVSPEHALNLQRLFVMTMGPLGLILFLMRHAPVELEAALSSEESATLRRLYECVSSGPELPSLSTVLLDRSVSDRIADARNMPTGLNIIPVRSICDLCHLCHRHDLEDILTRHCSTESVCAAFVVWHKTVAKQYLRNSQVRWLERYARGDMEPHENECAPDSVLSGSGVNTEDARAVHEDTGHE